MNGSTGIRSPEEAACHSSPSSEDFSSWNPGANPTSPPAAWGSACANSPITSRKNTDTVPSSPRASAIRSFTKVPSTKPATGRLWASAKASNAIKSNSMSMRKARKNTGSIRSLKTPNNFFPARRPSRKYIKREPARELPERAAPWPSSTSAACPTPSITSRTTAAPIPDAMPKSPCSASSPMAC